MQLQYNKVGKDQVEYKHNENNELGLERKYNNLQNQTLEDKLAEEKINWEKIKTRYNLVYLVNFVLSTIQISLDNYS